MKEGFEETTPNRGQLHITLESLSTIIRLRTTNGILQRYNGTVTYHWSCTAESNKYIRC